MPEEKVLRLASAIEAVRDAFCYDCRRFHKLECDHCDVDAFMGTLEEIADDETEVLLPDRPKGEDE